MDAERGQAVGGPAQRGLRMKELVAATGLPKSTLLYYVDQGLLPPPVKTSPNMAYYDPVCVARAALIKDLQTRRRLPLGKIRSLLELADQGHDINPLTELYLVIFSESDQERLDLEGFCQATGLGPEQVQEAMDAELILPLEPGWFNHSDVLIGRVLARGLQWGMSMADMEFYPRLAKEIITHEIRLRGRLTAGMPVESDAQVTMQMVESARAMRAYILDRIFQHRVSQAKNLKDEKLLS